MEGSDGKLGLVGGVVRGDWGQAAKVTGERVQGAGEAWRKGLRIARQEVHEPAATRPPWGNVHGWSGSVATNSDGRARGDDQSPPRHGRGLAGKGQREVRRSRERAAGAAGMAGCTAMRIIWMQVLPSTCEGMWIVWSTGVRMRWMMLSTSNWQRG